MREFSDGGLCTPNLVLPWLQLSHALAGPIQEALKTLHMYVTSYAGYTI